MCVVKSPTISAASSVFAASDNSEAVRQSTLESQLRRRRRGAAANVLTGAGGIPAQSKLGGTA